MPSFFFAHFSKDLQILTTTRHLVHFNLQIALGLTQIVFLAGGTASHKEVGNLYECHGYSKRLTFCYRLTRLENSIEIQGLIISSFYLISNLCKNGLFRCFVVSTSRKVSI